MNRLLDVYRTICENDIFYFERPLPFSGGNTAAVTVETNGAYGIFVDPDRTCSCAEQAVTVAHEVGHCMTGATHALYSPLELIQKHEYRADKWAIHKLIPKHELDAAIAAGCTETWELAEHFEVTEDFMRKAINWYSNGNIDAIDIL